MIDLHKEAQKRGRALTGDTQHYSSDCHLVGIYGEKAFADLLGVEYVPAQQADGGVDFEINNLKIDVKTARNAGHLLEREGKVRADIYVLARFIQNTILMTTMNLNDFKVLPCRVESKTLFDKMSIYIEFVGWEWGHILTKQPTKSFGHGVVSHYEHVSKLKPMARLLKLLKGEYNEDTPRV